MNHNFDEYESSDHLNRFDHIDPYDDYDQLDELGTLLSNRQKQQFRAELKQQRIRDWVRALEDQAERYAPRERQKYLQRKIKLGYSE